MTEKTLGPIVTGKELESELRKRKNANIYKTITGSTKRLIAKKVKLEEDDGWQIARKNKNSTRMAKPKPDDERLEDDVWCMLARMGFKEMSSGRHFSISENDKLKSRQIDVFAKDDESVILVECTQKQTYDKKNMAPLIEKIRAFKGPLLKSIRKHYGKQSKLKVKFAIATKNVDWSDADLLKCKEAQIVVIADQEIEYYTRLVQHLKRAARFQFLAHLFQGQKVDGLERKVMATRGKVGGDTFYTFLIRPDDLLKIAYVGQKGSLNVSELQTYQRMLQPNRLRKIAKYINEGGKFPTNIVVNLKTGKNSSLNFDLKEKVGEEAIGTLHIPPLYASAWIIDGQHRLYGYAIAREDGGFNLDKSVVPVLAYENLTSDVEMNLFIDINSKQVKVKTGLLVELYTDLHWYSSNPEEAFQALLSRISSRLNTVKGSPLNDRMVVAGKKKTPSRCLTQTSIRDGLKTAKLLGTYSKGSIIPGPLSTCKPEEYEANLKKGYKVVSESLKMFSTQLEDHWTKGDAVGGYLCTNNGIRALFHVIEDVAEHVRQKYSSNLCTFTAEETISDVAIYLQILVDYFKSASPEEIQSFRNIGSSLVAVRKQSYEMEVRINDKSQSFCPEGLVKYINDRDVANTKEAAAKVTEIHRRLSDYVLNALKSHYESLNQNWWTEGVPLQIRLKCSKEWEEKKQAGKVEEQLYLIDYIDICHNNWEVLRDVVSLDEPDIQNKKKNTKWIKDINEIRQKTTHPEHGPLSSEEVAYINSIFVKVEQYLPDNIEQIETP